MKQDCGLIHFSYQITVSNSQPLWARQGTPVDYLLYATITSGTTDLQQTSQRNYLCTELVNLENGDALKESAEIRKGYSKNAAANGGIWIDSVG